MDEELLKQQQLAEKKKRRLERNRASARECRKRKKEKKLQLRAQLAKLETDNLQLRLKLQIGKESLENTHEKSSVITNKLNELIQQHASESEIQAKIQELKEHFADYGRDRRSAIDFHINQVRRCLEPTQTTKAILWIMRLAPKFRPWIESGQHDIPVELRDLFTLWENLLSEVHPDPEQRKLIVAHTSADESGVDPFDLIDQVTDDCDMILDRIVEIIYRKINAFDSELNMIEASLSPRQIAKFILWVDQNPACIQMLEALWPHLTYSASNQGASSAAVGLTSNASQSGGGRSVVGSGVSRTASIQTSMSTIDEDDDSDSDESR
jgi:hypothetical protein